MVLQAKEAGQPSLVHVTYLGPVTGPGAGAALPLTEDAYRRLIGFVEETLRLERGRPVPVPGFAYSRADAFFEAHGSYSLVNTCNAWVGRALCHARSSRRPSIVIGLRALRAV